MRETLVYSLEFREEIDGLISSSGPGVPITESQLQLKDSVRYHTYRGG